MSSAAPLRRAHIRRTVSAWSRSRASWTTRSRSRLRSGVSSPASKRSSSSIVERRKATCSSIASREAPDSAWSCSCLPRYVASSGSRRSLSRNQRSIVRSKRASASEGESDIRRTRSFQRKRRWPPGRGRRRSGDRSGHHAGHRSVACRAPARGSLASGPGGCPAVAMPLDPSRRAASALRGGEALRRHPCPNPITMRRRGQ